MPAARSILQAARKQRATVIVGRFRRAGSCLKQEGKSAREFETRRRGDAETRRKREC